MRSDRIIILIDNPNTITGADISTLENILIKYPYFQVGQLLLTKGLKKAESIRYNNQLKKTAAYSIDRKKLFNVINLNSFNKNKYIKKEASKSIKEKLRIGEPLEFINKEKHSFSEWLTVLNIKKIDRKLINNEENFLERNIRISKPKKDSFFKATDVSKESLIENHELVTPTLARVYLEQEHYNKAISVYQKLILKYPKKSSFFVEQIKLITKLNKK